MVERKVIIDKLNELVSSKITIITDTNPFLKIFKPFIERLLIITFIKLINFFK